MVNRMPVFSAAFSLMPALTVFAYKALPGAGSNRMARKPLIPAFNDDKQTGSKMR